MEAQEILNLQKKYFESGATLKVSARKEALRRLRDAVIRYEDALCEALYRDLGKSRYESYMCEIGLVRSEISHMLRHVGSYAREKKAATPLVNFISKSYVKPSPYGCVLIMSPWNYPFLLTLTPLADALAAGNTAVLKPSAYSPHTSLAIKEMIESCFPQEYVAVVTGGRAENRCLLELQFDSILFTGSTSVGREVAAKAAARLIPVTLELGGKSPCIVDRSADLALAAKRIVFGKYVNCGQTCVAPDYVFCDAAVKDRLIKELKKQIEAQYGDNPLEDPHYGKIINEKHFDRLCRLLDPDKTVIGGEFCREALKIAPTVMDGVDWEDPVMGEEVFGPILPVLTYGNLEEAASKLRSMPAPLALYLFSSERKNIACVTERIAFGGGCVNDTLVHLATSSMGFGGVGESGMGAYHGKRGFDAFTHYKSILDKKTYLDLPIRYRPYGKWKDTVIRTFVK